MRPAERTKLSEIALLFLKLGSIAFGGPAAHVAMMEQEVVRRRGWLTRDEFLDFVGATNLIPGPNSTELAIHIGHARAGWRGLLIAGSCFILPATIMVGVIAWGYVRFQTLPALGAILYGIKPVVIVIVLQALWTLGRSALKSRALVFLALLCLAAVIAGANELLVLGFAGAVTGLARSRPVQRNRSRGRAAALVVPFALAGGALSPAVSLTTLFGVFFKAGALLFGSGYVLLAFLRADLVQRLHWLTEQQLLDAIAVGQFTPGPVFTTATFVGYVLAGIPGAAVATIAIFLPAFVFVAISGPLLPRIRRSPVAGGVLDGVIVASLALMTGVTLELGRDALPDVFTVALAAVTAALLVVRRTNSAWLVLLGAAAGLCAGWFSDTV